MSTGQLARDADKAGCRDFRTKLTKIVHESRLLCKARAPLFSKPNELSMARLNHIYNHIFQHIVGCMSFVTEGFWGGLPDDFDPRSCLRTNHRDWVEFFQRLQSTCNLLNSPKSAIEIS